MSDATCWKAVPRRGGQETNNCPLEDACCEHHQITKRGKKRGERKDPKDKEEPQKSRELPGRAGKTKNCTDQTELARAKTTEREPVQLVEIPPIPLTEASPQGIKSGCNTKHPQIKGRGPKAIRHSKFRTHKYTRPSVFH